MKKIAVFIADGSEEIESLTPVDVLRRANVNVDIVSVGKETVTGSHGINIVADKTLKETNVNEYDGIVIPGGMPGALNIAENKKAVNAAINFAEQGKLVAAICAAPAVVLAANGITDGKKATCFPAEKFINAMKNAVYTASSVEADGNIITANGPRSAIEFALKICEYLGVTPAF